jgi:hypothetical protein
MTSWGFEVLTRIPSYPVKYLAECRTWHSNLSKMFDSAVPTARHHSTRYTGESEVPVRSSYIKRVKIFGHDNEFEVASPCIIEAPVSPSKQDSVLQ